MDSHASHPSRSMSQITCGYETCIETNSLQRKYISRDTWLRLISIIRSRTIFNSFDGENRKGEGIRHVTRVVILFPFNFNQNSIRSIWIRCIIHRFQSLPFDRFGKSYENDTSVFFFRIDASIKEGDSCAIYETRDPVILLKFHNLSILRNFVIFERTNLYFDNNNNNFNKKKQQN